MAPPSRKNFKMASSPKAFSVGLWKLWGATMAEAHRATGDHRPSCRTRWSSSKATNAPMLWPTKAVGVSGRHKRSAAVISSSRHGVGVGATRSPRCGPGECEGPLRGELRCDQPGRRWRPPELGPSAPTPKAKRVRPGCSMKIRRCRCSLPAGLLPREPRGPRGRWCRPCRRS